MFDPKSRYAALGQALYLAPDGREHPYRLRRFLPQLPDPEVASEVVIGPADRLDLIAARQLGDPLAFWRIADANPALNPFDLVVPGKRLKVPRGRGNGGTE